jgi:glycosyltransferase involved in cell wall biosynthesis
MRRNNTIGFDAQYANTGNATLCSYARFIIGAMAEACPRHSYFRMYVSDDETTEEYAQLAAMHNVESMEPDGAVWRKLPWLWRLFPIGRDLQRGDVELFHSLSEFLPMGLERRGIRGIVTVHSLEYLRLRSFFTPLHNLYRRITMSASLRRADRIIAVSESVKRDLVRYLKIDSDKIDVIYRGCHRRFSEPISDERRREVEERYHLPKRYMLFVGTHLPRKNISLLIETMPKISEDIELVIVGRATTYTKHIKHRIKSLGLQERIHMLHGVADEDMPAVYASAQLYIMPSLYEGFPPTIIEALTVGIPVIATKGSSMEEAGGPTSIYINSSDHNALADAITEVMTDDELRTEMIREGRSYVSRFRAEVIAYNIMNSYKRIGVDISEY